MKYLVQSKGDDYGKTRTELVDVTAKIAKEYYYAEKVSDEDFEVLAKYISFVDKEDESERDDSQRYYGN